MTLAGFLQRVRAQRQDAWVQIVRRDPCCYCGRMPHELPGGTGRKYRDGEATVMTVEHVVPRSAPADAQPRGWQNLVGACWSCNHTRGDVPLLHYLLGLKARPVRARRAPPVKKLKPERQVPPLRVPLGEHGTALRFARLKVFGGE